MILKKRALSTISRRHRLLFSAPRGITQLLLDLGCLVPLITGLCTSQAPCSTLEKHETCLFSSANTELLFSPKTWCSVLFVLFLLHFPGNPHSGAAGISQIPAPRLQPGTAKLP